MLATLIAGCASYGPSNMLYRLLESGTPGNLPMQTIPSG